jgi:hypothetical protein
MKIILNIFFWILFACVFCLSIEDLYKSIGYGVFLFIIYGFYLMIMVYSIQVITIETERKLTKLSEFLSDNIRRR